MGKDNQIAGCELDGLLVFHSQDAAPFDDHMKGSAPLEPLLAQAPWRVKLEDTQDRALESQISEDIAEKIHGPYDERRNRSSQAFFVLEAVATRAA